MGITHAEMSIIYAASSFMPMLDYVTRCYERAVLMCKALQLTNVLEVTKWR